MKKIIFIFSIFSLLHAGKITAQENFKWQPENNFHATAMNAFHSAEINKLQPARDSAASILVKAQAWQSASIPAAYDAATVKSLLQNLYDECKAISDAVALKKTDAELKPLVLKAHHTFHEIAERTE